jgi:thiol-disulfide isomerase/thioredoxin
MKRVLLRFAIVSVGLILAAAAARPASSDDSAAVDVKLEHLNWSQFQARLAANDKFKYTLVDAWATTCGPCKENFPHVIEMHRKYAKKGLAVISLSLDDPTSKHAIAEAEKFLKEKKSVVTNVLLEEEFGVGFEKLGISTIPAVFLYSPSGKELKRFTMDDPNNQFTYDEVEKAVVALLDGKP